MRVILSRDVGAPSVQLEACLNVWFFAARAQVFWIIGENSSAPLRVVTVRSSGGRLPGGSASTAEGVRAMGAPELAPPAGSAATGCRGTNGAIASAEGARPACATKSYLQTLASRCRTYQCIPCASC